MSTHSFKVVVVNVTSEYILHCIICIIIIIILYCTFIVPSFDDVFPVIKGVINVIGHARVEVNLSCNSGK